MDNAKPNLPSADTSSPATGLSYKFQRLRERLRAAVASGELSGKLPGERALAKRFHVNAKTLSKALTDLAAEGLLDRCIGRGTYVKGQGPAAGATKKSWLVLCDQGQADAPLLQALRTAHPDLDIATDVTSLRPSFLNQFSAVIDLASDTPDQFLRELVVRNVAVVIVGREPRTYSTHAVLFDVVLAASQIGRDLALAGHHHLAAVEKRHSRLVTDTLSRAAARYAPDVRVDTCVAANVGTVVESGVTAIVCQTVELADQVRQELDRLGIAVPDRVSLAAMGPHEATPPCTGYFLSIADKTQAVVDTLTDLQPGRPAVLWLAGHYVDRGTVSGRAPTPANSVRRYDAASA